jgi:periplasmic protein TonB
MNMYQEPSQLSGRKGAALTAVILLHVVFGFAFYSELGARIRASHDPSPLNLTPLAPPKETIKPPPVVPLMDHKRIFATQPDFPPLAPPSGEGVTVEEVPSEPPRIIPQAPPPPSSRVAVRMDPKHPLKIGKDYYPDASVRANEMGRCVVQVTVAADGRIIAAAIQTRSGFDRLDQACLYAVRGQRMLPAIEGGKPIESTASIPILWNLSE